ncbi:phosphomannomutase [Candidatus Saccharibacteria bacterium]|nr:phosphomannomutase [Candidatus Saccharibacteria bacterium]
MYSETLTHTPVELGFGTSGLRALVTDMTDLECYINARGFLSFVRQVGYLGATVYIGGDLRQSTPRIMAAIQKAIVDEGFTSVNCGFIPTPALALHAQRNNAVCIMVTGSHIPDDRNGVKFYRHDGEIMKEDEIDIKDAVRSIRSSIYAGSADDSLFDSNGAFKNAVTLDEQSNEIGSEYLSRFTNAFLPNGLANKTIVVYQHSAVGRDLLVQLLEQLGATTIVEGRSEKFVPIDTENVTPDDSLYFKSLAEKYPDAFAIVSTDGDSDRPFVVDENGLFHRGDELGVIVAEALHADFCAYPISTNDAVDTRLEHKNIPYQHTKIGSTHVIVAMQRARESGHTNVVGWEANGGFLTESDINIENRTLERLPTRDAFLPIVVSLLSAASSDKKVSELFADLPQRFTQAGLIDNFPTDISKVIMSRYSDENDELREELTTFFSPKLGFSDIVQVDSLDGIRIYFSNNDVAHIRPSGNAPQLRIYSVADTQERADAIVTEAIKDQNGIFRAIEKTLEEV